MPKYSALIPSALSLLVLPACETPHARVIRCSTPSSSASVTSASAAGEEELRLINGRLYRCVYVGGQALRNLKTVQAAPEGQGSASAAALDSELKEGNSSPSVASWDVFRSMPSYPSAYAMWLDEGCLASAGEPKVRIDLAKQRGYCYVDGKLAMDFPVCSGARNSTPRGTFSITQKDVRHRSNIYDCPMPYFMRLTNGGIGLHVGDMMGYPASHGCIRLPEEACKPLFRRLPCGVRVQLY